MNPGDFNPYTQSADKDKDLDGIIRPQELEDFTGQSKIIWTTSCSMALPVWERPPWPIS